MVYVCAVPGKGARAFVGIGKDPFGEYTVATGIGRPGWGRSVENLNQSGLEVLYTCLDKFRSKNGDYDGFRPMQRLRNAVLPKCVTHRGL